MLTMKGISLYDHLVDAYGNDLMFSEMQKLKAMGVNTVACTVYFDMYTYADNSVHYAGYSPSKEWIRAFVSKAHGLGLKVVFKPHVSCKDGRWGGRIYPTDWNAWFESYRSLLVEYARLCEEEGVEILCVGNELSSSTGSDEKEPYPHPTSNVGDPYNRKNWYNTIAAVKSVFTGKLAYAAHIWQVLDYSFPFDIPWIDYVGVNGYFPVSTRLDDSVETIMSNWETMSSSFSRTAVYTNWKKLIRDLQARYAKPLIFMELGYKTSYPPALEEEWNQANSFEAFFRVWAGDPNIFGLIIWCWTSKDRPIVRVASWVLEMSPQDKLAEEVIGKWFAPTPLLNLIASLTMGLAPVIAIGGVVTANELRKAQIIG